MVNKGGMSRRGFLEVVGLGLASSMVCTFEYHASGSDNTK